MPKSVTVNYTDTPISGVTSLELNRGLVNFGKDFAVKLNAPNEAVLTNLTSPVGYPEKFRIRFQDVSNVYQGSNIDPTLYAPTKRGVSVVVQLNETLKVSDTENAGYEVALPVQAHMVLKLPVNSDLTSDHVMALVGRMVSGLFETGSTSPDRLNALLRGSLIPSDL